jgi:hypothetical protein
MKKNKADWGTLKKQHWQWCLVHKQWCQAFIFF